MMCNHFCLIIWISVNDKLQKEKQWTAAVYYCRLANMSIVLRSQKKTSILLFTIAAAYYINNLRIKSKPNACVQIHIQRYCHARVELRISKPGYKQNEKSR